MLGIRKITLTLVTFLFCPITIAVDIDFFNLKPSDFQHYTNQQTFQDNTGRSVKIKNTEYYKGFYIKKGHEWLAHGVHYRYLKEGVLANITTYKLNVKSGPYKHFHPDGSLAFEYTLKNNKRDGVLYQYRDNSLGNSLFHIRNYINGKLEGKSFRYNTNGKLLNEYNYKNNMRDGATILYDPETGIESARQHYKNGILQFNY